MSDKDKKESPWAYLKILLIDDELDFHEKFCATIKSYKHVVTAVLAPAEGIRIIKESYAERNPYDVVFIDYLMPNLNGVEVAKALKKIDPDLILVALTRDGTIETKLLIVKSRAFDLFFVKDSTGYKIDKILACLESTKKEHYSGRQSRLSAVLKEDQQKKRQENPELFE